MFDEFLHVVIGFGIGAFTDFNFLPTKKDKNSSIAINLDQIDFLRIDKVRFSGTIKTDEFHFSPPVKKDWTPLKSGKCKRVKASFFALNGDWELFISQEIARKLHFLLFIQYKTKVIETYSLFGCSKIFSWIIEGYFSLYPPYNELCSRGWWHMFTDTCHFSYYSQSSPGW